MSPEIANRPRAALGPILVLSLTLAATCVPFAIEPPGRDQSLFLAQADLLLEGQRLYVDVWEHKPPGVILAYSVALFLFGRAYASVQALDLIASFLTSVGIWLLVRRLTGSGAVSLAAGAMYLVFRRSFVFGGFWGTAQPETLMDPLVVGALLLLVARASGARSVLAGLSIGATILLKYSALPLLAVFWIVEIVDRNDRENGLARFGGYLAGAAIPWVGLLAYLSVSGGLAEFLDATIAFNTMHREVSALSRLELLSERILYGGVDLALLHTLTLAGWPALRWAQRGRGARAGGPLHGARCLLYVGTLLWLLRLSEVFWQAKFWVYHYQTILLPLCLASAAALILIRTLVERWLPRRAALAAVASLVAIGLIPHAVYTVRYVREHRIAEFWAGTAGSDELEPTYTWGERDYDYAETASVAAAVVRDTDPDGTILVWGFEPGVYFLSGRRPATRFLYDYPLMPRFRKLHARYVGLLLDDLRRHPPALILVLRGDRNPIETLDSWDQLSRIPPLARLVRDDYAPSWRIGDFHCYRRRVGATP